ncbi:MAG: hypothetical protein PWQ81_647 [Bacteroidota bacterium]|jgi:hypothetical protein|nr:hypothetical protein [Bacteroidota bacterium]
MSLNFLSQFSLQVRNDSCCFLKQSYTKVMAIFLCNAYSTSIASASTSLFHYLFYQLVDLTQFFG